MTDAVRRPVTAQDLTRLRGVSDPQISPDGRRVAFVMTTASQERDEYLSNVWVVDVNGGEPRRLTTGPTKDTLPRWSPDGRWLAFASDRGTKKKPQLYAMPADGGEATQLTDLPNGVFGQGGVAWSPDSTRLAFVARVGGWQEPEREEDRGKSRPAHVISTLKYRFEGVGYTYDRPRTSSSCRSRAARLSRLPMAISPMCGRRGRRTARASPSPPNATRRATWT